MERHPKNNPVPRGHEAHPESVGNFSRTTLTLCLVLFMFLVAFAGRTLMAQDTTGTILGTITDQTGANVPNADVTVTNRDTNVARALKTNDAGAFTAPNLNPGFYNVTIKMQGFQTTNIPQHPVIGG